MKTSNVLASVLFGAIAAAAPFDKRALVTRTVLVTETVLIYTTVYGDDTPIAPATTTPGLFFEKPKSSKAVPSSTSVYTPPVVAAPSSAAAPVPAPSSVYVPPVVDVPSSSVVVPAPKPTVVDTPAPAPTSVYVPPAPVSTPEPAPAPVPSSAPPTSNPSGEKYHGDITVYDTFGAFGACGSALQDTDMIVALSAEAMGASTYDVMTGAATNVWCGQKITIQYNGKQVSATIEDKCPGCGGYDIDLSRAVWGALGITEDTRLQADWWKS